MTLLKRKLTDEKEVGRELYVVTISKHTNHNVTKDSISTMRIDDRISHKLQELVKIGVCNVQHMKTMLDSYVNELFSDSTCKPDRFDSRFYPTRKTIQSHIHTNLVNGRYSNIDQENVEMDCKSWKENVDDKMFFRKAGATKACIDTEDISFRKSEAILETTATTGPDFPGNEDDLEYKEDSFLYVYQTSHQQQLLQKYGTMAFLDATYRTTKYTLPLFMLVVKTNIRYMPVAFFVVESETTSSIAEALHIVKSWNPDWVPEIFMTDYSQEESNAIQMNFPKSSRYLCAFHREQAWERWTKKSEYFFIH